jgi:fructoselysine-6-phosphate deglycase
VLNFDESRYVRIQSGALALAGPLHDAVRRELERGAQNLFFIGTGGVAFLMQPAARLLRMHSRFPTFVEMAAELVRTDNVNLGPESIVVIPSVSGTTKESLAALEFVKAKGAYVITLTGHAGTPLAVEADLNLTNVVADDTSSESYYLQSLLIALSVMDVRGEISDRAEVVGQLTLLPSLLVDVKKSFEARAAQFASEIKDEQHHIFTGAGGSWFEAWYYGMCILEEMQRIWTRPVHASDFFHGTLELVEPDTSLVIFKGEDDGRALAERVERFARTVSRKVRVFDTADFALPGVSPRVRELISPVLLAAAFERVSAHLEVVRDFPLTTRRYYKKGDF